MTHIHHINFVVNNLDEAIARFKRTLNVDEFEVFEHPQRGSRVARTQIGESWLVLVCPDDPDSIPGRYLKENGEGVFLLSFGSDNIEKQLEALEARGVLPTDKSPRDGVGGWRVADIGEFNGVILQLAAGE